MISGSLILHKANLIFYSDTDSNPLFMSASFSRLTLTYYQVLPVAFIDMCVSCFFSKTTHFLLYFMQYIQSPSRHLCFNQKTFCVGEKLMKIWYFFLAGLWFWMLNDHCGTVSVKLACQVMPDQYSHCSCMSYSMLIA